MSESSRWDQLPFTPFLKIPIFLPLNNPKIAPSHLKNAKKGAKTLRYPPEMCDIQEKSGGRNDG